jgi:anti-sigma factor RsiW
MNARDEHLDEHLTEAQGAYLLGTLDDQETQAVNTHLAQCPECRTQLDELVTMRDILGEVPPEAFLDGPPEGGDLLLQRTLRQVRTEKKSVQFTRRVVTSAAAIVVIASALGGGVLLGKGTSSNQAVPPTASTSATPTVVPGKVVSATQAGASITARITPAAGWVRVNASVTGIPAGQRCRIVVKSRSGTSEVAGSWLVSPAGATSGTNLDGAALVAPQDAAAIEVQNFEGHTFVAANL